MPDHDAWRANSPKALPFFTVYLGDFLISSASCTHFGYMGLNWAKVIPMDVSMKIQEFAYYSRFVQGSIEKIDCLGGDYKRDDELMKVRCGKV